MAMRGYLLPFIAMLIARTALSQPVLDVVPAEISTNKPVTVLIETAKPQDDIEIRVLAKRVDTNNDGVIDHEYKLATPTKPSAVVKDLIEVVPHAKDENPLPQRITFSLRSPGIPGEYLVEAKSKAGAASDAVRQPLLVYAMQVTATDNEASLLNRWPAAVPKIVLAELYRPLRAPHQVSSSDQILWKVDIHHREQPIPLTESGFATDPQWAPAGPSVGWLAYSFSETAGEPLNLWIVDTKNPQMRRQITKSAQNNTSPAWSPDGKRLAFIRVQSIYVAQVHGAQQEKEILRHDGIRKILAWDDRMGNIVFSSVSGPNQMKQIWSVNVVSGKQKALTYHPSWDLIRNVATSDNRTRLLFEWTSRISNKTSVYALKFPEMSPVNVTDNFEKLRCRHPSLSADGEQVVFVTSAAE